jgi:hypothetical protein
MVTKWVCTVEEGSNVVSSGRLLAPWKGRHGRSYHKDKAKYVWPWYGLLSKSLYVSPGDAGCEMRRDADARMSPLVIRGPGSLKEMRRIRPTR